MADEGAVTGTLVYRYQILGELGRGGMARVYRARDLRHGTDVAFKLLRREFAGSVMAKRFAREVRIASALEHPNILPVFDAGELQGLPYYVMPLVDGETLEARLRRERRLAIRDAVRLIGEVASALSYAHAQGVVHRDIKPSNILLSQGHALVADFGIARHVEVGVSDRLTDSGVALGTAHYMSPEQGHAAEVTGRGDIYSLGCVLYEMLSSKPPFGGPTPQAILEQHAVTPVPPLRLNRRDLPVALEEAVLKALAKDPDDRFADPMDFKLAIEAATANLPELSWFQMIGAKLTGRS